MGSFKQFYEDDTDDNMNSLRQPARTETNKLDRSKWFTQPKDEELDPEEIPTEDPEGNRIYVDFKDINNPQKMERLLRKRNKDRNMDTAAQSGTPAYMSSPVGGEPEMTG